MNRSLKYIRHKTCIPYFQANKSWLEPLNCFYMCWCIISRLFSKVNLL